MMKPQFKADWIAALRGDQYTQFHGSIGKGKHLCCIGVGGAIAGLNQTNHWFTDEVARAISLDEFDRVKLINLNDVECIPFKGIANWIEANISAED